MRLRTDVARVRVPATSANLGPGFDALGLALELYDDVEARATAGPTRVTVIGAGAGEVPTGEDHLVVRAATAGLEYLGASLVGFDMVCRNRIPHGRGLGSSAAAVVAGLAIARELVGDRAAMDDAELLRLATRFEGHPDNAAPAVLGGATIAWTGADVAATRLPVHESIRPIILIPEHVLATSTARTVLPEQVPLVDAARNIARAALLVEALTRTPALLFEATADALHQEARREVLGPSADLLAGLRAAGYAAVVSGAGPSLLVLATDSGREVERIRQIAGEGWRVGHLPVSARGVHAL